MVAAASGVMSQWSLTFEVRKRTIGTLGCLGLWIQSQWSLTFEVRKRLIGLAGHPSTWEVAMEPDL